MIIQTSDSQTLLEKLKTMIEEYGCTLDVFYSDSTGMSATVLNNKYVIDLSWTSHAVNGIFVYTDKLIHKDFIFKIEPGKIYEPIKDIDLIKCFADEIGSIKNLLRHLTSIEINSADEALNDFDSVDFSEL